MGQSELRLSALWVTLQSGTGSGVGVSSATKGELIQHIIFNIITLIVIMSIISIGSLIMIIICLTIIISIIIINIISILIIIMITNTMANRYRTA